MKLNRGMLWATVAAASMLVVGSVTVTVVGVPRSGDENAPPVGAEQAATETDGDAAEASSATPGTEEYRGASRGGGARGGSHGAGHGFTHGGGHGYGRGGYAHGNGGYGRWGGSRWGRWGGGRYVGGRWVGGPYYGWCNDSYYSCNRAWW